MSALCIREMSGTRAAAHTGAGFKHGPNLDVDATHVAIIFALGHTAELGVKLAQECNRRGGKVVLVSSEEHTATEKLFPVRIEAVPEPWEGITSLLVRRHSPWPWSNGQAAGCRHAFNTESWNSSYGLASNAFLRKKSLNEGHGFSRAVPGRGR